MVFFMSFDVTFKNKVQKFRIWDNVIRGRSWVP